MRRRALLAALALVSASLATVLRGSATVFADGSPRPVAHARPAAQPGLTVPDCGADDYACKCEAYKAVEAYYLRESSSDASTTPAESAAEDGAASAAGLAAADPCSRQ